MPGRNIFDVQVMQQIDRYCCCKYAINFPQIYNQQSPLKIIRYSSIEG